MATIREYHHINIYYKGIKMGNANWIYSKFHHWFFNFTWPLFLSWK